MERLVALRDLVEIKHGFAFPGKSFSVDSKFPTLLTPGNFSISEGFRPSRAKTFQAEYDAHWELPPGSAVVTMTDLSKAGDTLGNWAIVPNDGITYLHNQRIGHVIVKNGSVDLRFLSYRMRLADYHQFVLASATGTTVRHTSPNRILEFELLIPELSEQRAIAEVLGALDDKIAANSRIAETSDSLVRSLYSALPPSTTVLGDLCFNIREQVRPQGRIPYVGLEHLGRQHMWLQQQGVSDEVTSAKSVFSARDVLFGKLRPYFHKVVSAPVEGMCSTDILVLRARDPDLAGYVLAAASSAEVVDHSTARSAGTKMPRASWTDLSEAPVRWADQETAVRLSSNVVSIREAVEAAIRESAALTELRDTLLPALMDGRLRVRDAIEQVEGSLWSMRLADVNDGR
ncbi:MAG: restriction endonuclease subunit S [Propionibacteriaceae bacterium]|nr:restriction endonuclease subunit S [Propionibacteriaceae bacterium]